jgi:hypothetical protein
VNTTTCRVRATWSSTRARPQTFASSIDLPAAGRTPSA